MTEPKKVYDIDLSQPVTALMVRDAMMTCFYEAHCEDTGLDADENSVNKEYCRSLVKKAFSETGSDFEHPTKAGIMKAMGYLAVFSENFRSPEVIRKHEKMIMQLIEKLK